MEKEFIFEKTVYLTDTNLFGNAYFARYFDWQGMAREEFFRRIVGEEQMDSMRGIKLVTIEAHIKYHSEVTLFDEVVIKVRPDKIKTTTFNLTFTYINKKTGDIVAAGEQKIGFVDAAGRIIPIPEGLRTGWERFKSAG